VQLEENNVGIHMLLTQSRNQHVPVFGGVRQAICSLVCLTP